MVDITRQRLTVALLQEIEDTIDPTQIRSLEIKTFEDLVVTKKT